MPEAKNNLPAPHSRQLLHALLYHLDGCSRHRSTSSIPGVVHPCSRHSLSQRALTLCPLHPHPHSLSQREREASRSALRAHLFTLGEGKLVIIYILVEASRCARGAHFFTLGELVKVYVKDWH